MAEKERVIEVSGADIDEAISKGLEELGMARADVQIEVLDSGSSGFLGIGGREALVKLTAKPEIGEGAPAAYKQEEAIVDEAIQAVIEEGLPSEPPDAELEPDAEAEETRKEQEVALEIVDTLLSKLQFEATTSLYETEPDDLTGERRWVVDISGKDLGMLIGTRGETLNALQHVARLMTGHSMRKRPTFIIDVQGYRSRREQALARLAERMANKVVERARPMTLEPMPPNERRIIHLTLRDDDRVYTESFGEGRKRKVRIYPVE